MREHSAFGDLFRTGLEGGDLIWAEIRLKVIEQV